METYNVTLTLSGTGRLGSIDLQTPLEKVTVKGSGHTYVDAVNDAIHKLSRLLAKKEADSVG